jgi:hypothetical protein
MPFRPGDNHAICDRCGFKGYRSEMTVERHTGFLVHTRCLQQQNPVEEYRYRERVSQVKDPRPPGDPVFIEPGSVRPSDYPSGNMGGA